MRKLLLLAASFALGNCDRTGFVTQATSTYTALQQTTTVAVDSWHGIQVPVPALQYDKVTVGVDLTIPGGLQFWRLELQYPSTTGVPGVRQVLLGPFQCSSATELNVIFDGESTNFLPPAGANAGSAPSCGETDNDRVFRPAQPGALMFPYGVGGQSPFTVANAVPATNQQSWSLHLVKVEGAAPTQPVVVTSWSLTFRGVCTTFVSNSQNLAREITSAANYDVVCLQGYSLTTPTLQCTNDGPTPVACINGGGAVLTWGLNANRVQTGVIERITDQLGRSIPVNTIMAYDDTMNYMWLPNGMVVTKIALGDEVTFALTRDGLVYMWGRLFDEECTNPPVPPVDRVVAKQVAFPGNAVITQIYAGWVGSYMALASGGTLFGWGLNHMNQLGLGTAVPWTTTPTAVPNIPATVRIADVDMANGKTGVVSTNGEVWMWGSKEYFSIGATYTVPANAMAAGFTWRSVIVNAPIKVMGLPRIQYIAMTDYQTAVMARDGTLFRFGVSAHTYFYGRVDQLDVTLANTGTLLPNAGKGPSLGGTLGQALNPLPVNKGGDYIYPSFVDDDRKFIYIDAYSWAFAALTTKGEVVTWGYDIFPGNLLEFAFPFPAPQPPSATNLPATPVTTVGVLGRPMLAYQWFDDVPKIVVFNTAKPPIIEDIAMGGTFGLALDTKGGVWQWGNLFVDDFKPTPCDGEGSAGNRVPRALALPPGDLITLIFAGRSHAAALDLREGLPGCPIVQPLMTSQNVNFIRGLQQPARGKFVASMSVTQACETSDWVNNFVVVDRTPEPYAVVMPAQTNGVQIIVTNWGVSWYVIITAYTPTGRSAAALGISPTRNCEMIFLFAVEQLYPDATMADRNGITFQVTNVPDLAQVSIYRDGFRSGKLLTDPEGYYSYTDGTVTILLTRASGAVAGYGNCDSDDSNEGLLGLLALILLPVLLCLALLGYLWWKYTKTPAVMEAMPAQPAPPAYMAPTGYLAPYAQIPNYLPTGGYLPNGGYLPGFGM